MRSTLQRILLLLIVCCFLGCENKASKMGALIDFVPQETAAVFKITAWKSFNGDLGNSGLLGRFNKTTPYTFFSDTGAVLKYLHPEGTSLICINSLTDSTSAYTFITKYSPELFIADSIPNKVVETLTYDNKSLQRVTINDHITFTAVKDSIFIASSSQKILQDLLDGNTETDAAFRKVYSLNTESEVSCFLRDGSKGGKDTTGVRFASWLALDTQILPDGISGTGVVIAADSLSQLLNIFEGQIPQQNDISKVIPTRALGAMAFTFNDASLLHSRLQAFRQDTIADLETIDLFSSINEIGTIDMKDGKAVVLKSIDPEITFDALSRFISESDTYKEVTIHSFNAAKLFTETFTPLITEAEPSYLFQLDSFFVFSENQEVSEAIITAYINQDHLFKTAYYEAGSAQLSNASSLLFFALQGNVSRRAASFFHASSASEVSKITLSEYPMAALQFSYDRNFAHVNLICQEATRNQQTAGTVSEIKNVSLPNEIMGIPQLFTNHRTRGKDLVVQDIANILYFISAGGKTLWTKKLGGPILGEVQEVDLLRNGKKQLAFATKNKLHIIDRNGNPVAPFPIQFKDDITQPLAVFDYDRKRNYRFVVTQGANVLMYDRQAKIVSGFTFEKASSEIVMSPQHIRMASKDYILIAEENGKLNILSRVGKERINVSQRFKFTNIPIAQEGQNFVIITQDQTKESISQNGKVVSRALDVSQNYWFTVNENTKVTLDDNLLRINGKLVELPFGIYTAPKIFVSNRRTYIAVTETQEHKVYIYDRSGTLIPGFPVYGTSDIDLGDANRNNRVNLLTKGESNSLLLYEIR